MSDAEPLDPAAATPSPPPAPAPPPGRPAGCGWCSDALDAEGERTCAGCGARFHRTCVARAGRCASESCAQARPSHPAWTLEARAEGWLLVPAPPPSPWLRRLLLLAALTIAGAPDEQRMGELGKDLVAFGGIEPWMLISAALGLSLTPWAALLILVAIENATQRGALVDAHGVLFDHSPTWRGERLVWDDMLGFRLTDAGVRLVVRRRPWTRLVGPTIPCLGRAQHELIETLERRGVRRFDA